MALRLTPQKGLVEDRVWLIKGVVSSMEIQLLLSFFVASVLLALAPGPDNLYVISVSATKGWRAGVMTTLGLCSGLVGHGLLVALGVASILLASPTAMMVLKWLGAGWLVWIGFNALKAAARPAAADADESGDLAVGQEKVGSAGRLFRRGVVMNLSNPKVFIFFLAFLPQFLDPNATGLLASSALQIGLFSLLFMLAALLVFSTLAVLSDRVGGKLLGTVKARRILDGLAGVVFIGLAVRLATSKLA